jgi:hypothetical protein
MGVLVGGLGVRVGVQVGDGGGVSVALGPSAVNEVAWVESSGEVGEPEVNPPRANTPTAMIKVSTTSTYSKMMICLVFIFIFVLGILGDVPQ